jgi:hypothetical protein
MPLRPSTTLCLTLPKQFLQAARAFSRQWIRLVDPLRLKISTQQRFPTPSTHNTHLLEKRPHAAFTTTMSDEFEEYIDWSKGDLLDACNDPAIGGMVLGR